MEFDNWHSPEISLTERRRVRLIRLENYSWPDSIGQDPGGSTAQQ